MDITDATRQYETRLAQQIPLMLSDLTRKHQQMAADPFSFLRATFYRWAQLFASTCAELAHAPAVLAVGDLHIENFGTWRDREGRLIWGINDLDEACPLSYANDLIRLAVSAKLAIDANQLSIEFTAACNAMLTGYTEAINHPGQPFVLAESHGWLRELATSNLRDPTRFWSQLDQLPTITETVPLDAITALEQALPEVRMAYRIVHRQAGLGSLGRQRWLALADWHGGKIAREAKPLVPSAALWADAENSQEIFFERLQSDAVRMPDPYLTMQGQWLVRRLAPDCARIELASLPQTRDEAHLLHAMGHETANIHLGSREAVAAVRADLQTRGASWLHEAAKSMSHATTEDWQIWKAGIGGR
jgi:uncharacterized protein (DUF2252 family)